MLLTFWAFVRAAMGFSVFGTNKFGDITIAIFFTLILLVTSFFTTIA
jgi:hypothetical protein